MVVIRLSRGGAKKRPFYQIVVADRRRSRDGRYIEKLGFYNPLAAGGETRLSLDHERFQHWEKQGAQPSERVKSLIKDLSKGKTGPSMLTRTEAVALQRKADATAAAQKAKAEKAAEEAAKAEAEKAEAKAAPAEESKPAEEAKDTSEEKSDK